jgi:hypothetical protein
LWRRSENQSADSRLLCDRTMEMGRALANSALSTLMRNSGDAGLASRLSPQLAHGFRNLAFAMHFSGF